MDLSMQKSDLANQELTDLIAHFRQILSPEDYAREYMGEWTNFSYPPQPIYVLASNYQIAKSVFDHYFLIPGISRRIDLRYIDRVEKLYGVRNQYIVVSNEKYPHDSFYDRLGWIREQSGYRQFEVVYEPDLEKEQVREKVSRQRPQDTKG